MNWQELIDDVYEYWQNNSVNYGQVLDYADSKYGKIGELAILLKNYNYQVENGGHYQYFDNGYCQNSGGCFDEKDEKIPLHHKMVALFEYFKFHETEAGKPVYEIMNDFKVYIEPAYEEEYEDEYHCPDCDGTGYTDEDEQEICGNCSGYGYITEYDVEYIDEEIYIPNLEALNNGYYKVNNKFLDFFNAYITALGENNV